MIGNDPRYQAIIDAYTAGQLQTTAPQYNPIYDIRREQIEAGELEEGARFPRPQLDTTPAPVEEGEGGETFDPCPQGYQLIDEDKSVSYSILKYEKPLILTKEVA